MSDAVCVMLLCWSGLPERIEYARRTLDHLILHLEHDGPINLVIADDGPDRDAQLALVARAIDSAHFDSVGVSNGNGEGYGANYNNATQYAHAVAEYILPIEDDWELTRTLNLASLVEALKDERIDCIRLGYLGFLEDGGFLGRTIHAGGATYLLIDPASPDPHVFSGNPRLETRRFERAVGLWPLGLNPGATEWDVAHYPEARRGVAWPMDIVPAAGGLFAHVGTVQARRDQE